jgi:hypothetical protein
MITRLGRTAHRQVGHKRNRFGIAEFDGLTTARKLRRPQKLKA